MRATNGPGVSSPGSKRASVPPVGPIRNEGVELIPSVRAACAARRSSGSAAAPTSGTVDPCVREQVLDEGVRGIARVLAALTVVREADELPHPVLRSRSRGRACQAVRVGTEEAQQPQLDTQLAGAHIAIEERREHPLVVLRAERTLKVRELDHRDRRVGGSERDAGLRNPAERRLRRRRAAALGGAVLPGSADGHRSQHRHHGKPRQEAQPNRSSSAATRFPCSQHRLKRRLKLYLLGVSACRAAPPPARQRSAPSPGGAAHARP